MPLVSSSLSFSTISFLISNPPFPQNNASRKCSRHYMKWAMLYRSRFQGTRLMWKPSVFVSSTCYDLRQVRADLHSYLENAGLDPVLSEFPSFPVDPACPTITNCRKAVENRADILVLIIGGRYGSTDDQGRSITNPAS